MIEEVAEAPKNGLDTTVPLPGFGEREQRIIVKYLTFMKEPASDIHKLLSSVCGETAVTYRVVKRWIEDDAKGLEDEKEQNQNAVSKATNGTLSPKNAAPTDPALVCRIEFLVNNDRRVSVERAADMSTVSRQQAQHVICDVLGLKRVCERWVPRLWTPEQRNFRVSVADELLQRHEEQGDAFLDRIIVGDETLVYYFTPDQLHRKSSAGLQGAQGVGEKYRPSIEQVRVYFMVFYDVQGLLLAEPVPDITDACGHRYAKILRDKLTDAYAKRRKGKDLSKCILLHDNTAAHSSTNAKLALKDLGMTELPHPPASPDLEPHEYWLIPFLRSHLHNSKLQDRNGLIAAVQHHLKLLIDSDFNKSIKNLPKRWESCKDTLGLYVL